MPHLSSDKRVQDPTLPVIFSCGKRSENTTGPGLPSEYLLTDDLDPNLARQLSISEFISRRNLSLNCSSPGSRASPSRRFRSCCAISASSSRMRLSIASRSSVLWI